MTIGEEVARKPRQTALLVFALMHISMGFSVLGQPTHFDSDLAIWHTAIPLEFRVSAWFVAGIVALSGVFSNRLQTAGFVVATLLPTERALSYGWSWLMWVIPGPPRGNPWGLWDGFWWALLAFFAVWAAGLVRKDYPYA